MFVVCGINQQAPIELREQIAVNDSNANAHLNDILRLPAVDECLILSTCHRVEIYAQVSESNSLLNWWQAQHPMLWPQIKNYVYCLEGQAAKAHCLRVACGLDSMLLGEPQILGQLKQAFQQAHFAGAIEEHLHQWFEFVFQSAKKIRHESGISLHPISVASVAVDCIYKHFQKQVSGKKALIVGSGDTARLAALHLREKGLQEFLVTSRHLEHAEKLAYELHGQAIPVIDLQKHLPWADIIITATSCPYPFITKNSIQMTLAERQNRPMFLVDLAVPRDIEADVDGLEQIDLINIDSLQKIQEQNTAEREKAAAFALEMTELALIDYTKKRRIRQAQHVICDFRQQMHNLAAKEVHRAEKKLQAGDDQYDVLNELASRLIQKLIHSPTIGLQEAAIHERHDILDLANYLFNYENV